MLDILFWLLISGVFYTYGGYPLILWLLAKLKRTKPVYSFYEPTITILVTAFNEEKVIAQKIENCLNLNYPLNKMQILIADDGSDDRTREIIQSYAGRGVELAYNPPRRGKMGALNRAMDQAVGEIVVFSDATNIYKSDVLVELGKPFANPQVGAVIGSRTIDSGDGALGDSEGLYWRYESFIQEQETKLGSMAAGVGDIFAVRKVLFEPPPDDILIDDFYMAMRLIKRGYNIVHAPNAQTSERISLSAKQEIERRARMVAGRYQAITNAHLLLPWNRPFVVWQIVSHKFLRPLVPLMMIGIFLLNVIILAWPYRPVRFGFDIFGYSYEWICLMAQLCFYLMALFGNMLERYNIGWLRLLYIPTFLVNSNWGALKGLVRFLTGQQTTIWIKAPRRESIKK